MACQGFENYCFGEFSWCSYLMEAVLMNFCGHKINIEWIWWGALLIDQTVFKPMVIVGN